MQRAALWAICSMPMLLVPSLAACLAGTPEPVLVANLGDATSELYRAFHQRGAFLRRNQSESLTRRAASILRASHRDSDHPRHEAQYPLVSGAQREGEVALAFGRQELEVCHDVLVQVRKASLPLNRFNYSMRVREEEHAYTHNLRDLPRGRTDTGRRALGFSSTVFPPPSSVLLVAARTRRVGTSSCAYRIPPSALWRRWWNWALSSFRRKKCKAQRSLTVGTDSRQ